VVTFNSQEEIAACLASLMAQRGVALTICVVDNASADGTAALIRTQFPGVQLEVQERNLGFGRASNRVLSRSPSPYFALVNPDPVLPPDAIAPCLEYLMAHPDVGFVGTRLVTREGKPHRTGHRFLGLGNLFLETFGLDRMLSESGPSFRGWRTGPNLPPGVGLL